MSRNPFRALSLVYYPWLQSLGLVEHSKVRVISRPFGLGNSKLYLIT